MQKWLHSESASKLLNTLIPIIAAMAALAVGALMLLLLGENPFIAFGALLEGSVGSVNALADTVVKATPLLLVGLGICIAFRANVINIGGNGQMIVGALASIALGLAFPDWPGIVMIPLALLVGFLSGGIWGGIPGAFKAFFNVNENLSTIMMNAIAVQLMNYFLSGPMIDPIQLEKSSRIPQTARLAQNFDLPRLVPTRLHLGVLIAIALAVLVYILLWRTTMGYRIRAVGLNPDASRYAGMDDKKQIVLALFLSGGLAGLAGAIQVFGVNHRLITDGSATGFNGNAGFNGIVAALFGQLHPLTTIPAAFLFGALLVGANKLQRVMQVPTALITTFNGLVVIFVVSSEKWREDRERKRLLKETERRTPEKPPPGSLDEAEKGVKT